VDRKSENHRAAAEGGTELPKTIVSYAIGRKLLGILVI
jgi:hypothetical protein